MSVFVVRAACSIVRDNVAVATFRAGSDSMCHHKKRQPGRDNISPVKDQNILFHGLINRCFNVVLTDTRAIFGLISRDLVLGDLYFRTVVRVIASCSLAAKIRPRYCSIACRP